MEAKICFKEGHLGAEATAAVRRFCSGQVFEGLERVRGGAGGKLLLRFGGETSAAAVYHDSAACVTKEKQLRDHGTPGSQRPQRTQANFRDRAGKKTIHSRLGDLP